MPEHREPQLRGRRQVTGQSPDLGRCQGSMISLPALAVGQQCLGVTRELGCVSQLGVQLSPVPAQWQVGNREVLKP